MNNSLGSLLKRVKAIYAGSVHGPGRTALYLVRWNDGVCGSDAERWRSMHPWLRGYGMNVDDIDVNAEKGKYINELSHMKARFNGRADCIIPVETINRGNIGGLPAKTKLKKSWPISTNMMFSVIRQTSRSSTQQKLSFGKTIRATSVPMIWPS